MPTITYADDTIYRIWASSGPISSNGLLPAQYLNVSKGDLSVSGGTITTFGTNGATWTGKDGNEYGGTYQYYRVSLPLSYTTPVGYSYSSSSTSLSTTASGTCTVTLPVAYGSVANKISKTMTIYYQPNSWYGGTIHFEFSIYNQETGDPQISIANGYCETTIYFDDGTHYNYNANEFGDFVSSGSGPNWGPYDTSTYPIKEVLIDSMYIDRPVKYIEIHFWMSLAENLPAQYYGKTLCFGYGESANDCCAAWIAVHGDGWYHNDHTCTDVDYTGGYGDIDSEDGFKCTITAEQIENLLEKNNIYDLMEDIELYIGMRIDSL